MLIIQSCCFFPFPTAVAGLPPPPPPPPATVLTSTQLALASHPHLMNGGGDDRYFPHVDWIMHGQVALIGYWYHTHNAPFFHLSPGSMQTMDGSRLHRIPAVY